MMTYWGFDLGDGESTVARVQAEGQTRPEIVPVDGSPVLITAWALMKNGELRIGERAAKSASAALRSAARFKGRFLDEQSDSAGLIRDFSAKVFELLRADGAMSGGDRQNSVYIGCPAGWDKAARERYLRIFETLGCPSPRVISESRAVMVGAVQSNSVRDHIDLRQKSVLVVDIGSSTTDFAYIHEGKEAEIRTGGEVALGGGVMDELLLELCIAASPKAAEIRRVFAASESWRVDCELKARRLKERYFSRPIAERDECGDALLISYDEPLIFDLHIDASLAHALTERACPALGGRSFREVFRDGLKQVRESIGDTPPELLFLTGGVSRMEEVRLWCREIFPEAVVYTDLEPEFSVARGLAWCGRIDDELSRFRAEVDELIHSDAIETIVSQHLSALYQSVLDRLLDPLLDKAVRPVLIDWRDGRLNSLEQVEGVLRERIKVYLHSDEARELLYRPVSEWMTRISAQLEEPGAAICRRYHVPDHALNISSRLDARDLKILEKVDARSVFAGDALAGAAFFVESVISVIVGLLCGGSGLALVVEGPVGIAIGVISSLLLFAVGRILGKKSVDEKIRQMNLPLFVRRAALSELLPKLEPPQLNPLKQLLRSDSDEKGETAGALHLLPRLRWAERGEISERRMLAIRRKVKAGYDELLQNADDEGVQALNRKMCREISEQIEQRLKALAEQVEIPL
ncbi:MAG: Hsp70 family protein [Oscillospiraceae bacterium]|nr:Hsp70 family protein [Oscillospiraceae bacterium]